LVACNRDEYLQRPTLPAQFWASHPDIISGIDAGRLISSSKGDGPVISTTNTNNQDIPVAIVTDKTLGVEPSPLGHGSWFGVSKKGRIAFVTNHRVKSDQILPGKLSRGHLVRDFLTSSIPPEIYMKNVLDHASKYNGFNLVVGDLASKCFVYGGSMSNVGMESCQPGVIYGVSNGEGLDSKWPKVEAGRRLVQQAVNEVNR